jgi:2-deoxy-D-gluconate 3-dehydrogenase
MLNDLFGLTGKAALVTGAGRGLGRVAAIGFAEAGADVALLSRSEGELDETAQAIRKLGRQALVIPVDLKDTAALPAVIEDVVRAFGRLDILVNNAAAIVRDHVVDVKWPDYDLQMDVNVRATFALCQAAVPHMIARKSGKIINVTALAAVIGFAVFPVYAMSKAAISLFTKSLAMDLAKQGHNIQANCIGPGAFATHMNAVEGTADNQFDRQVLAQVPMNRKAQPEELKGTFIYLASKASSYLTGQDIYVDGGWLGSGV